MNVLDVENFTNKKNLKFYLIIGWTTAFHEIVTTRQRLGLTADIVNLVAERLTFLVFPGPMTKGFGLTRFAIFLRESVTKTVLTANGVGDVALAIVAFRALIVVPKNVVHGEA